MTLKHNERAMPVLDNSGNDAFGIRRGDKDGEGNDKDGKTRCDMDRKGNDKDGKGNSDDGKGNDNNDDGQGDDKQIWYRGHWYYAVGTGGGMQTLFAQESSGLWTKWKGEDAHSTKLITNIMNHTH